MFIVLKYVTSIIILYLCTELMSSVSRHGHIGNLSMACENVAYCPNPIRSSAMPVQMVIDWDLAYRKRFLKPNRHLKCGM